MADRFACNLEAVRRTVRQLNSIATELREAQDRDDQWAEILHSDVIRTAIDDFGKDSSDFRGKVTDAIDGIGKILDGLVKGADEIDKSLRETLPDIPEPAAASSPSTASPGPAR